FQAEDGIRDFHVTGVQTCALPIRHATKIAAIASSQRSSCPRPALPGSAVARSTSWPATPCRVVSKELRVRVCMARSCVFQGGNRSEERRVGKECRCSWSTYHAEDE